MSSIEITSPLVLHADPVLPEHAVTKQYVDNKRANLSASAFTVGTINPLRLPALSGDVSSVAGSGAMSLNVNGVVPGAYAKVTVDATGRVTGGGALSAADIASVSWNKITSGRPTTAAGYGITNLVALSGGVVSGAVVSTAVPSAGLHAVTKGYVDDAITGAVSASLSPGDVVRKPVALAPAGFLRANGGEVSKTTFAGLFAVLGDAYAVNTSSNAGKPWRMQYGFNTQQTSDITGWTTATSLPATVGVSQAIVTNQRVFLLGGRINGANSATVYTAPINADGTLGTWTTTTPLPVVSSESQAIVTGSTTGNQRVHLLGGNNGSGVFSSTVYTAPINADGTLGVWTTTAPLPNNVHQSQAVVTNQRVYLLGGGINGGPSSLVHTAPINADGTLGSWTTTTPLPTNLHSSQVIIIKQRIFLLGGTINGPGTTIVYTALINEDGTLGTWTISTPLPSSTNYGQAVVSNQRVFLLGGNGLSTVLTAPINADGTLGTWVTSTPLPATVTYSQAIVTNQRIFLLGGYINSAYSSTVYTAPFLGGLNDYTLQISGAPSTPPSDFRLPDFTTLEKNGINYFIKT